MQIGIAHLGLGNFARAHLGRYADDMLALHPDEPWGIVGIGVRRGTAARSKAGAFHARDCLSTLVEASSSGERTARVLGSVVEYIHYPDDPQGTLHRLASSAIDIISLTITEGGYGLREDTGEYDLDGSAVSLDLADPDAPTTAIGLVVAAMGLRYAYDGRPPAVLSCDNLRSNGDTARLAVVSHAAALDPDLAAWIDAHGLFPNSMVDCIVPTTTAELVAEVKASWGVDDPYPVLCESFKQWVVEEPAGRLARLTAVGVEIVEDVAPYEAAKVRVLNASHVMLGYLGLLLGHRFVYEAVADRDLNALVRSFMKNDVFPYLQAPDGLNLADYHDAAMTRFANPAIRDQLARLAADGAAKLPTYVAKIAATLVTRSTTDAAVDAPITVSTQRIALVIAAHRAYTRAAVAGGNLSRADIEPTISDADWRRLTSPSPRDVTGCDFLAAFQIGASPAFAQQLEAACVAVDSDVRAAIVAAT